MKLTFCFLVPILGVCVQAQPYAWGGLPGDLVQTVLAFVSDPINTILNVFCVLTKSYTDPYDMPKQINYDTIEACVDTELDGCDSSNVVGFAQTGERDQDFLYNPNGPEQIQGVIWLTNQGECSSLMSLSRSSDASELANTGELREADERGFNYVLRVTGNQNWAYATNVALPCFGLVEFMDVFYAIRIMEGTVENPTRLRITPNLKVPFTNWFLNIDDCREYTQKPFAIFDMVLVTKAEEIVEELVGGGLYETTLAAFEAGSAVWRRDTWLLLDETPTPYNTGYVWMFTLCNH